MQDDTSLDVASDDTMVRQRRELLLNQWWETLSTAAKTLFFFAVTPVLLHRLGTAGYGFFALALSTMTCLLAFDFGLRIRLRLALSAPSFHVNQASSQRAVIEAVDRYLELFLAHVGLAILAIVTDVWNRWTKTEGAGLLVAAMLGSGLYGLSLLLVEPLAARGQLSQVKAAAFIGNSLAIPVVGILAWIRASPGVCFLGYVMSLTVPNLRLAELTLRSRVPSLKPVTLFRAVYAGRWFGLTAAEWLLKSYLLTFFVGLILGPTEAGTYFILLKLSELVSVFGATASDTSTADLASLKDASARADCLRTSYSHCMAMSLVAFAGLVCVGPVVLGQWLRLPLREPSLAILVGTFGLVASFQRVLITACMGVSLTHAAALWGLLETAAVLGGSALLVPRFGPAGIMVAGTVAGLALLPLARQVASTLKQSAWELWGRPALPYLPGFVAAASCSWLGNGALTLLYLPALGFVFALGVSGYQLRPRCRY